MDVPRDIQLEDIDNVNYPEEPRVHYRPFRTVVNKDKLRQAANALLNAERPVL